MKKIKIFLITLFFIILTTNIVYAHQPRIVNNTTTQINSPEISQAFYGQLNTTPHYFYLNSEKEFTLYIGLLVPDIPNINKNISAKIYKDNQLIKTIDGEDYSWAAYHEEFANDHYFKGPEFEQENFQKGNYKIEIYNQNNQGKYVLAIGKIESFPLKEILNTIKTLPELKKDFFQTSPWTAFNNKIGLFIFTPILLIIVLLIITIKLIYKKLKK